MKTYVLDSARFSDVESFYDEVSAIFGFPEYFGRNLDAMADCLWDIEEAFSIEWKAVSKARTELGAPFVWDAIDAFEEATTAAKGYFRMWE